MNWFSILCLLAMFNLIAIENTDAQTDQGSGNDSIEIFAGTIPKGWHTGGWGHIKLAPQSVEGQKQKVLAITMKDEPRNWAGVFLSTSMPTGRTQFEYALSPQMKKDGFLVMSINGGNDEWGNPIGNQKLQVSLAQRTETSKWSHGSKYVRLKPYLQDGRIDNDPQTWQEVRIPLTRLLGSKDLPAIGAVFWQFVGTPTGSVLIRSIHIQSGS